MGRGTGEWATLRCGFTIREGYVGARNPVLSHTVIQFVQMLLTSEPHLFEVDH